MRIRNSFIIGAFVLGMILTGSFYISSCTPQESHLGIQCATFEDCELGEKCYQAKCVKNLMDPKNPADEDDEFAGISFKTTKMFFNGRVNLPSNFILPFENLQVLYGKDNYIQNVDPVNGSFWLRLNSIGTSLLILQTNYEEKEKNMPIMMTIFPTNGENFFKRKNIEFSVRETAVALIFLQPGIATTVNPVFNAALLEKIRNLTATQNLMKILTDKMTMMSPSIVVAGDMDIQNAIAGAIIELYSDEKPSTGNPLKLKSTVNADDQTNTFFHVLFKEILNPNSDEMDKVYIKYYNENGPAVKAYNTMPRWAFYFVDAMPVEAILPGDVPDTGIDDTADPILVVPPKNYVSPKIKYIINKYINENDTYIREKLLSDSKANPMAEVIQTYFDTPVSTEKTPLKYKKQNIEKGFVVGYIPGPDTASLEKRAMDSLFATYFSQLFLPMLQISGDISDNFKSALLTYDQSTNKKIDEHPVYMISKNIRNNGIGLRVSDLMKSKRGVFNSAAYKKDLYQKVMQVFLNSFLGQTKSSVSFLAEITASTGSESFEKQLTKVSNLVYRQVAPVENITMFIGMDVPIIEFTDSIFNRDTGRDTYYFNEDSSENDDDDGIVNDDDVINTTVCTNVANGGECPCETNDKPGCLITITSTGAFFMMGADKAGDTLTPSQIYDMEKPMHKVTMKSSYKIDKYEVTVAQYAEFLKDPANKRWTREFASLVDAATGDKDKCWGDPDYLKEWDQPPYKKGAKDNFPVVDVCWFAAKAYCEWAGRRLPTEEEWEFAAKVDADCVNTENACREVPWNANFFTANDTGSFANFRNSGDPYEPSKLEKEKIDKEILAMMYPEPNLTPVGYYNGKEKPTFKAKDGRSPLGLFDMAGNAEEWVATRFYYYGDLKEGGVPTPIGDQRAVRGGSWSTSRHLIRTSFRRGVNPQYNSDSIGFRCAKDLN